MNDSSFILLLSFLYIGGLIVPAALLAGAFTGEGSDEPIEERQDHDDDPPGGSPWQPHWGPRLPGTGSRRTRLRGREQLPPAGPGSPRRDTHAKHAPVNVP